MSAPNETWSERFEREFEAALALLRRRPLLAVIFAASMLFFAWHVFFKTKDILPNAQPKVEPAEGASQSASEGSKVPVRGDTLAEPGEQAIALSVSPTPTTSSDKSDPSMPQRLASGPPPEVAVPAEKVQPAIASIRLSIISLADYFDKPIVIGDSRKDVAEKIPGATWGESGLGIFASTPTKFLDKFPGYAVLFFSNDVVSQVNYSYGFSGSTMKSYRLSGTDDDWAERISTNGEDMNYAEATAKCSSFRQLRAELAKKFGTAKSIRNIPFDAPEDDPRTKKYIRPVEEQFDAEFIAEEFKLHISAYDFAFIREQTHTRSAKDMLSNRSCSIRADFKKTS